MEAVTHDAAEPCLLETDAGSVRTLTLNRPRQFNALSDALLASLEKALAATAADRTVRVVVLAGAGKAFCAGHDLKEMRTHGDPDFPGKAFSAMSRVMQALTAMPQPVIARVHGMAYAAGCQIVAQCDLAVAAEEATFATSGINFGLFCSTPGVPLSRNIPRKQAFEMLVTGEPMDARTALARGLVNRVVPLSGLDAEIERLVAAVVSKPPEAIAAGKKVFYDQIAAGMPAAYELATTAMTCGFGTGEAAEGISAFMERRPPRW